MMATRLTAEYRDDAERLAREGSLAWAAYVRRALVDDDLDVRAMSLRLGYEIGGPHVAQVLSRHHNDDHAPLDSTALELAQALTQAKPLSRSFELSP